MTTKDCQSPLLLLWKTFLRLTRCLGILLCVPSVNERICNVMQLSSQGLHKVFMRSSWASRGALYQRTLNIRLLHYHVSTIIKIMIVYAYSDLTTFLQRFNPIKLRSWYTCFDHVQHKRRVHEALWCSWFYYDPTTFVKTLSRSATVIPRLDKLRARYSRSPV